MKITCIGAGGAFSENIDLGNQCYILSENGKNLAVDFGQMVLPYQLKKAGLKLKDIDGVIVTHGHDDHIGCLGRLGLQRYDWARRPHRWDDYKANAKFSPYAPKLITNEHLMPDLWGAARLNLETMEGFVATLETFYETIALKDNEHYNFEGWDLQLVQQIHVMTGSIVMSSFGVFGKRGESTFFITSDTQYFQPRQVRVFYNDAKLIITDCETSGTNFKFQEGTKIYTKDGIVNLWPTDDMEATELLAQGINPEPWGCLNFMSGVHSSYPELAGYHSANATVLPDDIKKKIWLSHYGDHVLSGKDGFGNLIDWDAQAQKDGFAGFAKVGQVWEV